MDDLPEPTPLDTSTEGFQITDEGTAGWAVSTRRHAETRMQHRGAIAGQQIARLLAEIDEVTAARQGEHQGRRDSEPDDPVPHRLSDPHRRRAPQDPVGARARSEARVQARIEEARGSRPGPVHRGPKRTATSSTSDANPPHPAAPEVAKDEFKKRITDGTYQVADDGTVFDGMGSGEVIPGVRLVTGDDQFIVEMGDAPEVAA